MKKVIRLTERDLTNIVRRVINEEQVSQAKSKQMVIQAKANLKSCWNAEDYPRIYRALRGLAYTGVSVGLLAIAFALASTGVGAGIALALVLGSLWTGSSAVLDGFATLFNVGWQFEEEIKKLSSCLF
jgi:hypothetical protein